MTENSEQIISSHLVVEELYNLNSSTKCSLPALHSGLMPTFDSSFKNWLQFSSSKTVSKITSEAKSVTRTNPSVSVIKNIMIFNEHFGQTRLRMLVLENESSLHTGASLAVADCM